MRVEDLERELRAKRPEIDPEFARGLDDWAAAGFPRGGRQSTGLFDALARFRDRLRGTPPRRILIPVGAAATLILVVGVGVKAIEGTDGGGVMVAEQPGSAPKAAEAGGADASGTPAPAAPDEAYSLEAPAVKADSAAEVPASGRKYAQKVDLQLSTAPNEFRDAADGVLDVVADHRGFVVSSSVSGGDPGVPGAQPGRADFRLKIPARELPAALSALSDLGHVVARTDGSDDITGRFVAAKQRIEDFTKARQNLLAQLEDATTTTEQQSIRARLRIVEAQLDDAQSDLAAAQQRVTMVPVSVSIGSDSDLDSTDEGGGGWGIDDAFGDAGEILSVMAGVALITLVIVVPLSLIGAAAYALFALVVRRQRERALDA